MQKSLNAQHVIKKYTELSFFITLLDIGIFKILYCTSNRVFQQFLGLCRRKKLDQFSES